MGFEVWLWLLFGILIAAFLIVDLGITNRQPKKMSMRAAGLQASFWVAISLLFGLVIYFFYDPPGVITAHDAAWQYYTAYVTEYALSVDNIFVIIIILRYFNVEEKYHHKILFWGILGALVMRGIFILLGAYLIAQFNWILIIFGVFLLYTGLKMLLFKDSGDMNLDENGVLKFARRYLNFTSRDADGKFYIRENGRLLFTPMFLVLLLIESTDLIFAVDSIPAAFAITQDQVVLYTSNIFAIMGLRAMFFLLAGILDKFYLLKKGLSLVLIFIGGKMMLYELPHYIPGLEGVSFKMPTAASLSVIVLLLGGSIVLSLLFPRKKGLATSQGTVSPK